MRRDWGVMKNYEFEIQSGLLIEKTTMIHYLDHLIEKKFELLGDADEKSKERNLNQLSILKLIREDIKNNIPNRIKCKNL